MVFTLKEVTFGRVLGFCKILREVVYEGDFAWLMDFIETRPIEIIRLALLRGRRWA
jgi:hypothetical protein